MTTPARGTGSLLGELGTYPVTVTQAQAAAGAVLARGRMRLMGWSLVSGAVASTEVAGQVVSPGAGAAIVTTPALPAGDYQVTWTVELIGAAAAADQNNFQLQNGATVLLVSDNAGAAGNYPQPAVITTVAAGGTVSVSAVAAGTVGVTYRAQLVVSLLAGGAQGQLLDAGQVVGVTSTGADQLDTQVLPADGVYLGTSIAVLATAGKLSGVVWVRDDEHDALPP